MAKLLTFSFQHNILNFLFPRPEKTFTSSELAAEIGISPRELNRGLHQKGIQYRQGGMWILYAKFRGKGYTKVREFKHRVNGNTFSKMTTVWTEKGRQFIHYKLSE